VIDSHILRPPPPSDPWTLPMSGNSTCRACELKIIELSEIVHNFLILKDMVNKLKINKQEYDVDL